MSRSVIVMFGYVTFGVGVTMYPLHSASGYLSWACDEHNDRTTEVFMTLKRRSSFAPYSPPSSHLLLRDPALVNENEGGG